MSKDIHTIDFIGAAGNLAREDRVLAAYFPATAYGAGSGAGASVQVPVAMSGMPAKYAVLVSPDQDCTWFVTKTATGFTVTLNPRLAANTLASGALDIFVVA